jgi:transcriptional regulator of acetoin/glycerol metabolism
VLLTSAPLAELPPRVARVAATCLEQVALPPLRNRIDELPALVRAMLAELTPDRSLRLTPGAYESLAAQPWLGNLREHGVVLRHVVRRRSAGDVTAADLPATYCGNIRAAKLAGRERAERAAIIDALRTCGGNKARSAEHLGISRTTLYSRIKALGIAL